MLLALVAAQTATTTDDETTTITTPASSSGPGGTGTTTGSSPTSTSSGKGPPDVYLHVPELSVEKIELDVDNLQAEINLAAQVAQLVQVNAGVQVGVEKVNITIADVEAELELTIRLGNLVDIVNRTLASLDLNPLLINVLDQVGNLVGDVIGAVDGLLGSIVQGDSTINFLIDNLGNIVQEVIGADGIPLLGNIIGNFRQNMTYTGNQKILDGGLIQKTYLYEPLNALVNVVTNALDQVVQAVVVKDGGEGGGTTTSSTAAPTARRH